MRIDDIILLFFAGFIVLTITIAGIMMITHAYIENEVKTYNIKDYAMFNRVYNMLAYKSPITKSSEIVNIVDSNFFTEQIPDESLRGFGFHLKITDEKKGSASDYYYNRDFYEIYGPLERSEKYTRTKRNAPIYLTEEKDPGFLSLVFVFKNE